MAENDLTFPLDPKSNEGTMPPGSAIMPRREVNFADPTYNDPTKTTFTEPESGSIFKTVGINRPNNNSLSNAQNSQDYDFSLFNSYVHYMPNPNGGQGLLDKTPYSIKASIIYTRTNIFTVYSPYG